MVWSLGSGHLRRDLAPSRQDLAHIGSSIREHARLKFPKGEEAKRYNVLQKLAYLGVALVLLPLMLLTGLAMSPGMDAAFPVLLDIFGGRQTARTIHFISATGIVLFVIVHLVMVVLSGLWNNIRSMITGRYAIESAEEKS
jgi:thiosulfate reductase cytochrome b subunit